MSDVVWALIGGSAGCLIGALGVHTAGWHRHSWGKWSRIRFEVVNRGYEVDRQHRVCKTCGREQVKPL